MGNRVLTGMSGGATVSSRYRSSPAFTAVLSRFRASWRGCGSHLPSTTFSVKDCYKNPARYVLAGKKGTRVFLSLSASCRT